MPVVLDESCLSDLGQTQERRWLMMPLLRWTAPVVVVYWALLLVEISVRLLGVLNLSLLELIDRASKFLSGQPELRGFTVARNSYSAALVQHLIPFRIITTARQFVGPPPYYIACPRRRLCTSQRLALRSFSRVF